MPAIGDIQWLWEHKVANPGHTNKIRSLISQLYLTDGPFHLLELFEWTFRAIEWFRMEGTLRII